MVGRAMLSCDIDERWNGPPPRCEGKCKLEYLHLKSPFSNQFELPLVIECDTLPGNFYNTIISAPNGTLFGSQAEISCPPGYRLEGARILTCLSTGQWSNPLPRCIKLEVSSTFIPPTSPRPTTTTTTKRPFKPTVSSTPFIPSSTPVVEINGECKYSVVT